MQAVTTQRYDDAQDRGWQALTPVPSCEQARVRERNIRLAKLIEFKKETFMQQPSSACGCIGGVEERNTTHCGSSFAVWPASFVSQ